MKYSKYLHVIVWLIIALQGCEQPSSLPAQVNSQEYLTQSTLYVQQSAEYQALCIQAYHFAKLQLLQHLQDSLENPAVVLDIDETILDNSPYTAWQIKTNEPYSKKTWSKWVAAAQAELIPGAEDFLHFVDSLGADLFFISNRDTSGLAATMKNMREHGLPQIEAQRFFLKSTTSDKNERRNQVIDAGYTIVLYVGDNLGDFKNAWDKESNSKRKQLVKEHNNAFGSQFIVLPNPLYGTWERAVYNFDWSYTEKQRDSARKSALNTVEFMDI